MDFRTEYIPKAAAVRLDPRKPAVLLGSCFADNVGSLMRRSLWNAAVNPCGTLFNPASVSRAVAMALDDARIPEPWRGTDGIWRSWDFPAAFAASSESECVRKCAEAAASLRASLASADVLTVSFGTSVVYSLAGSPERTVANCHKQPSGTFLRRRMDISETVALWVRTASALRETNPGLKLVLTVSPVRHVREGFEENSLSKAALVLACDEICRLTENCVYFPAFEILNDDLRDYRFYASDLVHPSHVASEYVFGKFCDMFIDPDGMLALRAGRKLSERASHRPLVADSAAARRFDEETRRLISEWQESNPLMLTPSEI